ncbi:MAG TPA: aminoglycoside phosphotransferase family protein [Acidimicrobiales bacterium]|nr:aminoglycoside phosphotransferase family protein [Acidimicrobiales bacterium]
MSPQPRPAAEVDIDVAVVRDLLAEQRPDLVDRPLVELASGWDNVMVRVGDDLVARLPRREAAVALVHHEQRWLPALAPRLPLPVPVPVHAGRPGPGYPWPWSLVPWQPGASAIAAPPQDPARAAEDLGRFLAALHRPAPADAPPNPYRGVPLVERAEAVAQRLAQLAAVIDAPALARRWEELVATPGWAGPPVWLHGDLHPGNLLVHRGRLSGVVDFGDVTSGDPATDLAVAWSLLPAGARPVLRAEAGYAGDDATWDRARGWALALGLAYLAHSADAPAYGTLGRRALTAVLADG